MSAVQEGSPPRRILRHHRRPIACFCWSSAPRHLAPRDPYLVWPAATPKANIRLVAYQTRFLILPWLRVPHLASDLLGRMSRQLSDDWEQVYAHPIYFTETFVGPERNRGTCYLLYDGSACATLSVMHYFAGVPFKRIEALPQGWGVPLPDANQWRVVDECNDLPAPLYPHLQPRERGH